MGVLKVAGSKRLKDKEDEKYTEGDTYCNQEVGFQLWPGKRSIEWRMQCLFYLDFALEITLKIRLCLS